LPMKWWPAYYSTSGMIPKNHGMVEWFMRWISGMAAIGGRKNWDKLIPV